MQMILVYHFNSKVVDWLGSFTLVVVDPACCGNVLALARVSHFRQRDGGIGAFGAVKDTAHGNRTATQEKVMDRDEMIRMHQPSYAAVLADVTQGQ